MRRLLFKTTSGIPFLISSTITLFSGLYVLTEEHTPGIDDTIITWSFYISIITTLISFIIMWKNRYYEEDE